MSRIYAMLPNHMIRAIAEAADAGVMCSVVILSPDVIANLAAGKADMLSFPDGGVICLIPQDLAERHYPNDGANGGH